MTFPETVLPIRVEAFIASAWVDITTYVQRRSDLIRIRRGRSDEASETERSTATLSLNNRDGRFSPRNPNGPYYGGLPRNAPLRVSLPNADGSYMLLSDSLASEASAPDAAALGITGDIDIRFEARLDGWRGMYNLAGKYRRTADQRSWVLQVEPEGFLTLAWSSAGTSATLIGSTSTLPVPIPALGRQAVRATLDVNNGASGHTVTFYTSDTISGSWTQLGDPVITAGTTSIFDSTAPLEVGSATDLTINAIGDPLAPTIPVVPLTGQILAFELRSGIAGSVVANPVFTNKAAGTTSFADTAAAPNTWTLSGGAVIDDRDYRFHGEIPAWPSRWDTTGTDVYVDIQAAGILRRLGQARALHSTLRRALTTLAATQPIAYWPCEDDSGSTSIASGLTGAAPMTYTTSPSFGSSDRFNCSDLLPALNNGSWTGTVPAYTATAHSVRILVGLPDDLADNAVIMRVFTSGTAARWDVFYDTASGGSIAINVYNGSGTLIDGPTTTVTDQQGHHLRIGLGMEQVGADIDYGLDYDCLDEFNVGATTTTLAGFTVGRVTSVQIGANFDTVDLVVGHVSVHDARFEFTTLGPELRAYASETAAARFRRLCQEEEIESRVAGAAEGSMPMGPQPIDTLVNILEEVATTDLGILYEPRDFLGFGYRTRVSLYNQTPVLTLDYAANETFEDLTPLGDDQNLRNDVTVSQRDGTTAREVKSTGPLTPEAIGVYPENYPVNVDDGSAHISTGAFDDFTPVSITLSQIASWVLSLDTVDEERYTSITVNMANKRIAADADLVARTKALDIGDRLQISNLPTWIGPDVVDQLLQGATEVLGNFEHAVTMNTSPASPYAVMTLDSDTQGKLETDGSTLGTAVTSGATTLVVHTTQTDTSQFPIWTPDSAEYPFDLKLGGERVTATAIASLAADTFTRTVAAGSWGTSSDGHTYTLTGGLASNLSVAATYGLITLSAPTTTARYQTVAESCRDCEVRAAVAVSATATGGSLVAGIITRWTSSTAYYGVRVEFTTAGGITLSATNGTTVVGSSVSTGVTYSPGTIIEIRVRLIGNRILARVWRTTSDEPGTWHLDQTISSSTIAEGMVGLAGFGLTGNTNVNPEIRFHDWAVSSPQRITVTRSVNGIVKAHAAGTAVNLQQPAIIAL